MPLALEQDGFDVAALQLLECQLSADERRWRARRGGQVERKILRANHAATCEKNGALDDVPELADVAGPLILLQQRERVRRQRRRVAAAKPRQEVLREQRDVDSALSQRWQRNRDGVDSIE